MSTPPKHPPVQPSSGTGRTGRPCGQVVGTTDPRGQEPVWPPADPQLLRSRSGREIAPAPLVTGRTNSVPTGSRRRQRNRVRPTRPGPAVWAFRPDGGAFDGIGGL